MLPCYCKLFLYICVKFKIMELLKKLGGHTKAEWIQMINDKVVEPSEEVLAFIGASDPDIKITEGRFQSECYQWFYDAFPHLRKLLFHVPNGGKRTKIEAAQLKGMGVVKGISDFIFLYKAKAYFIELKNPSGKGVISKDQEAFKEQLVLHNFEHWFCDNLAEFKALILEIIDRDEFDVFHLCSKEDHFYRSKVFDYLYSLDGQRVINIADVCEKERINKFISVVSEFIEYQYGHLEGFEILFTPDYLAFYKQDLKDPKEIVYNGKTTI